MSTVRKPSRTDSESGFEFICDYAIKHNGEITFGWKCVATMDAYLASLLKDLDIKSTEYLPSCDSVCSENGAHQPSYDEFMSINKTILISFCKSPENCGFNVNIPFNFEKLQWTREDGTPIGWLLQRPVKIGY